MFGRLEAARPVRRGSVAFIEALESRQLLSAAGHLGHARPPQNASVLGTYSGTIHIGGKAANGKPDRAIAITFNSDIGDSWEWADDPGYPEKYSALGIRIGVNYVIYAMTH